MSRVPITRIEWDPSDALPFALCISVAEEPHVSVALGNIVLVEHGEAQPVDDLGWCPTKRSSTHAARIESATAAIRPSRCGCRCVTGRCCETCRSRTAFDLARSARYLPRMRRRISGAQPRCAR